MQQLNVPEDVRAELDLEERRHAVTPRPLTRQPLPDDVVSELDQEARIAREEKQSQVAEGTPPADGDENQQLP